MRCSTSTARATSERLELFDGQNASTVVAPGFWDSPSGNLHRNLQVEMKGSGLKMQTVGNCVLSKALSFCAMEMWPAVKRRENQTARVNTAQFTKVDAVKS